MKKIKSIMLSLFLCLFTFSLFGCSWKTPKIFTKTNELPNESYSRSTLENIAAYDGAYTYKDVLKMMTNNNGYMPSVGDVKILVIPIKFSDVYTSKSNLNKYHDDLERVFFGDDTKYESLSSYYEKSSYGQLRITGTVLPWYIPNNNSRYYENVYANQSKSMTITNALGNLAIEVLEYYSSQIDFSEYDYDKDGVIDGVYLVCNKQEQTHDSLYWSWVSYYTGSGDINGYSLYQFMWSNMGFIYTDDYYNTIRGDGVNAISFIHETGHMFGVDDFYDYSANTYKDSIFGRKLDTKGKGCNLGSGGYDMMDSNIGDHNANTKMMLGWITPYVVTQDTTIDLNTFSTTGDAIIVAPSFTLEAGNLSEYFVIEYYDHNGLADQNIYDARGYTTSGIRIYHVNAKIEYDGEYWSLFKYDNSYTNHAFLTLVDAETNRKGKTDFIDSSENASDDSLFQEGDIFIPNDNNEYVNKLLLNVTISIDSMDSDSAKISISFKD